MSDDDPVPALYREPIERFTAARDALAARLREDRPAEAAAVKALRKPTVPAWAVDQLATRDPQGLRQLLDAGAEVRAAQQAALSSGRNADRLRSATLERRAVVTRLTAVAEEVLRAAGRDPSGHLEPISATLEAASADPELGARVLTGTLDRPATAATGLGDVFGLRVAPEPEQRPTRSPSRLPTRRDPDASAAEIGRLRRDRDAAAKEARRTRDAAGTLAERSDAAEARLRELRDRQVQAEARALEAETSAARAQAALDRAVGPPGRTRRKRPS